MFKESLRSKVFFVLSLLLIAVTVALPTMLEGDGTMEGHVRLLLSYTLNAARFLLALIAIWSGCTAISKEIAGQQAHLIWTKPVHPAQVWAGKWLGLSFLLFILMSISLLTTLGMLYFTTSKKAITPEERTALKESILVARQKLAPLPDESVQQTAREAYEALIKEAKASDKLNKSANEDLTEFERKRLNSLLSVAPKLAIEALRQGELQKKWTLNPGETLACDFQIRHIPSSVNTLFIRYKYSSSLGSGTNINGIWGAGPVATGQPEWDEFVIQPAGGTHIQPFPASTVGDDGRLVLRYANMSMIQTSVSFNPNSGIELYIPRGSFLGNYLRAAVMLIVELLFLAAVGVTAGALFSTPVAALAAGFVVMLFNLGSYIQQLSKETFYFTAHKEGALGIIETILKPFFTILHKIIDPVESPPVLDMLANGEWISWLLVFQSIGLQLLIYCGILGLMGTLILRRREIGLPQ